MAAIGVGHQDLFLVGEGTALGVAERDLHLIAPPLGHLEVRGTGGRGRAGPDLVAIEQHLGGLAQLAGPEVPGHADRGAIGVDLDQLVVGGGGLIHLDDGELGFAPADGGFTGERGKGGGGAEPPDQERQQGRFWT
ncbi:hypothetical protein D3C76_1289700 [compost metagenome]